MLPLGLFLLSFIAVGNCALSGVSSDQINSVLPSSSIVQKETPTAESTTEKENLPKINEEKATGKVEDAAQTVEVLSDAKQNGEDVKDREGYAEDIIRQDDNLGGDQDQETDDDQQNDKEETGLQENNQDEEDRPKQDVKKYAKEDVKEEPNQGDTKKIMEQANIIVDIIHLLDGKDAFTMSPTGVLTLNVQWLEKNGGEAGQKLVDLVKDDKKAMASEDEIKSDAIFLKEGILSFKFGLKDDKDELNKKWQESGKKDATLEQANKNIVQALEKIDKLVEKFDDAISVEKTTSVAHKNGAESENVVVAATAA